ncbi:MAG: hypothetical protein LC792_27360, partial [Actinobacteria bacterium]|nr:hypothetical protein [Actinomycetota bacterium]
MGASFPRSLFSFESWDTPGDVAVQPDGRIAVAAGASVGTGQGEAIGDMAVIRRLPDGTPDTAFGWSGTAFVDFGGYDTARAVAVQPDGKIVVAGATGCSVAVVRLKRDGSLDTGFGNAGKVTAGGGSLCNPTTAMALA